MILDLDSESLNKPADPRGCTSVGPTVLTCLTSSLRKSLLLYLSMCLPQLFMVASFDNTFPKT